MALQISADKTTVLVGETVTISVTGHSGIRSDEAQLYINGSWAGWEYDLTDTSFTFELTPTYIPSVGTYAVKFKNNSGYSNELIITVVESIVHDYALSFDESSYSTCNGSVTVTATLTDNNNPVSGETVSLTGTGSTLTATTDSNGVATFNLSSISEDKTLTVTFDEVSDTASLTYGLATLNGSLVCLGKRMASNLSAMGVTGVDYSDGLTSLADSILDIAPTIVGIEFDTSVSCASSESSVVQGTQITLTGVLEADYNDTSQVNVDLEGYLSGATVKIYNGNTLLGSAITDSSGAYSFNYTPQTVGTMSIIAVFEGTTYFDTCSSSSVSVEVLPSTVLSLSATKDIISSADSESSTITASLTTGGVGVSGETLSYTIKHDSTVIDSGSDTTDANGEISFNYAATGIGNVDVIVTYGILLQETYGIEDCDYYNTNTISTATPLNQALTNTTACTVEFDLVKGASSSGAYLELGDDSNNYIGVGLTGSGAYGFFIQKNGSRVTTQTTSNLSNGTYHTVFTYNNGSMSCVINNQTKTYTHTQPITKILNAQVWTSGSVKNIKVKAL